MVGWLESISIHVTREEGPFLLRRQVVWKISDPSDWPYLRYPERYRFDADPLASLARNRAGNLYYVSEAPVTNEDVYYPTQSRQELTARQLAEQGIATDVEPT